MIMSKVKGTFHVVEVFSISVNGYNLGGEMCCCQKAKQENWQQHTKTVCTKNISEIWYHDLESKVFLRLQVFHVCQTLIQWPNHQGQGRRQPDLCCLSWPQWFLWTLTSQCSEKFSYNQYLDLYLIDIFWPRPLSKFWHFNLILTDQWRKIWNTVQ